MSTAIPDPPPISGRKRLLEAIPHARRLRSKISRRPRFPLLPIVSRVSTSLAGASDDAAEESSSSCLQSELSVESSLASKAPRRPRTAASRPTTSTSSAFGSDKLRPVTRLFAKQREQLRSVKVAKRSEAEESSGHAVAEIGVSEVSRGFRGGEHERNARSTEEKAPETSEFSCINSVSVATFQTTPKSFPTEISQSSAKHLEIDSELECSERLSSRGGSFSSYSTCNDEMTLSEFESELFDRSSGDYLWSDNSSFSSESGNDFSQRSPNDSAPAYFSFFLQLTQQFAPSVHGADTKAPSKLHDEFREEFALMRFEEEDDEESYKLFRGRERREAALQLYAEKYDSERSYGDLVLQQRLVMVNWIIEHSKTAELQCETLFLAVGLMDRFLSRGYFRTERNLQLLGIACTTLATRIEENQPYNSIRRTSFTVGPNVYSRSEVVAMEWLIQEVLKFQCFLPTVHNFLWFYLKAAQADAEVESLARYLAMLSLLDHERLSFWPSTVAAGLVILASLAADRDSSCHVVMETHVRTKNDDLPECIQSLEWLVKHAC